MIALEAILASEKFVAAPQMSAFLRYVVQQAASGNKVRIKAYTVAVDALGKPETFDPQNDPVVRVLAGRLRSSLDAYYENRSNEDVVIQMKPGSYVPIFMLKETEASSSHDKHIEAEDDVDDNEEELDHSATAANSISIESNLYTESDDSAQPQSEQPIAPLKPAQTISSAKIRQTGSTLRRITQKHAKLTAAASLLLAFFMGVFLDKLNPLEEPGMAAASLVQSTENNLPPPRQRPETLSLFISAMEPADSLLNQLNTMMSGVFSESEEIRVFRLMRSTQRQRFWPEDYLLSLNVLPMPDETQVSVQLVEALTGRISHMELLNLSADARERLSTDELKMIMDCARNLISAEGPLQTDYQRKISN